MDSKSLQADLDKFRSRLKKLRDAYSDLAENKLYVEVEDKARRAHTQLGYAQDSLDSLSVELARAEKHLAALVAAERSMNKKRKAAGEAELTTCHAVLRDFTASELSKLK